MKHSSCLIYHVLVFGYQWNTPSSVWHITPQRLDTSVTNLLVFDISLLGVWISDETLHIVFHVLLLSAWISDERILRVFYILLRILETEQFFLCWIYYLQNFFLRKIGHHNFFLLGPHIFEGQVDRQVDNALHSITVIPVASAIRFLDSYPPDNRDNDLSVG